jgi:hypothetical protein
MEILATTFSIMYITLGRIISALLGFIHRNKYGHPKQTFTSLGIDYIVYRIKLDDGGEK